MYKKIQAALHTVSPGLKNSLERSNPAFARQGIIYSYNPACKGR